MEPTLSVEPALTQALRGNPLVLAAWLFERPLTPEQRYALIESLAAVVGSSIDLIDLAAEHGLVAREALIKGRLLFSIDDQRVQERQRMLVYDAEDFLPALRTGQREALKRWIRTSPETS